MAKLNLELGGEPLDAYSLPDDNQGRPGGPKLEFAPGWLTFALNTSVNIGDAGNGECMATTPDTGITGDWPYPHGISCDLKYAGTAFETGDLPEAQVDAIVRELANAPSVYSFGVTYPSDGCNIFVPTKAGNPTLQNAGVDCGTITALAVSR